MLIGPRMRDGEQGYHIITPMERDNGYLPFPTFVLLMVDYRFW